MEGLCFVVDLVALVVDLAALVVELVALVVGAVHLLSPNWHPKIDKSILIEI